MPLKIKYAITLILNNNDDIINFETENPHEVLESILQLMKKSNQFNYLLRIIEHKIEE